jgi:hypothetical protein
LAHWLSPEIALHISHWIRILFIEGKVEGKIKVDIKLIEEKENIIKHCKKRIKILENLTLKKQPRTQYDESKNVVYIITNEFTKKNRTYTIGKSKVLVDRLSTYNKLQNHEVIYSKSFKDEKQMKIGEDMVLSKLNIYKEIECRDRFILPVDKNITFFKMAIDDAFNYLNMD